MKRMGDLFLALTSNAHTLSSVLSWVCSILGCEQLVLVSKREIVEGVMLVIGEEEQRYGALITTDFTKADAENRPIRAARLQKGILAGDGIGVAGWVKEKRREI